MLRCKPGGRYKGESYDYRVSSFTSRHYTRSASLLAVILIICCSRTGAARGPRGIPAPRRDHAKRKSPVRGAPCSCYVSLLHKNSSLAALVKSSCKGRFRNVPHFSNCFAMPAITALQENRSLLHSRLQIFYLLSVKSSYVTVARDCWVSLRFLTGPFFVFRF